MLVVGMVLLIACANVASMLLAWADVLLDDDDPDDEGADVRESQASMNRPMFANLLGPEWLAKIPDVDARLRADPPAREGSGRRC